MMKLVTSSSGAGNIKFTVVDARFMRNGIVYPFTEGGRDRPSYGDDAVDGKVPGHLAAANGPPPG